MRLRLPLLSLLILLGLGGGINAQPYGNEWINYSQEYIKIPVLDEGIYRINAQALTQLGVPVSSIPRRAYQLYRRGQEVAVFLPGDPNLPLSGNDFLDFYGRRNDGGQDTELYRRANLQPHALTSLFSDTASYFLTWALNQNGKRMATGPADNTALPTVSQHTARRQDVFNSQYSNGIGYFDIGSRIHLSDYDAGEHWTGPSVSVSALGGNPSRFTHTFNSLAAAQSGGTVRLSMLLAGRNGRSHRTQIAIGPSPTTLTPIKTVRFNSYNVLSFDTTLQLSQLGSGTLVVQVTPLGIDNNPDFVSVSYIRLEYPQNIVVPSGAATYTVNLTGTSNQRIQLTNATSSGRLFNVTDPINPVAQNLQQSGVSAFSTVDMSPGEARLYYSTLAVEINPLLMKRVRFRQFNPAAANYLIITNRTLFQPVAGVGNAVRAFANYRASVAGGRYDTVIAEIHQLYDQFAYGEYSPVAVKRFCQFMQTGRAQYLLLLGKGMHPANRYASNYGQLNMVPTLGQPASDIAFSTSRANAVPALATGRIAARNADMVVSYLNKLQQHESTPYNSLWRKNFVMAAGGRTASEQASFRQFVDLYARKVEQPAMGGRSSVLYRKQNSIVELIDISDKVNEGLSMVTIFGHSSIFGADIDIGSPSDPTFKYNNSGRYPLIMINGCYAGNVFESNEAINSDWVFTPNKGAVAFLGNTDEGLPDGLHRYVQEMLSVTFNDTLWFGKPLGMQQREAVRRFLQFQFKGTRDTILSEQFHLHGDPALLLFAPPAPDYKTSNAEVFVADENVSAGTPRFRIGISASNFGRAVNDSLIISVRRTYPDGSSRTYLPQSVKPVYYRDTVYFDINQLSENISSGVHRFEVTLNFQEKIPEMTRTNNVGVLEFFMPAASVLAVFPKRYSIVNTSTVQLMAQSTNYRSAPRAFLFEIDTSFNFNSPAKRTNIIAGTVLPTWQVTLPVLRDSIVYFWRVRFNDIQAPTDTAWARSSFTYIPTSPGGWSQGNWGQFFEATPQAMVRSSNVQRRWNFLTRTIDLQVITTGAGLSSFDPARINVLVNGSSIFYGNTSNCFGAGSSSRVLMMWFDRNTLEARTFPWIPGQEQQYWRWSCGREPMSITFFPNNIVTSQIPTRFTYPTIVKNAANPGDYLLIFNSGSVDYSAWQQAEKQTLMDIGGDTTQFFNKVQTGHPYIIFGQKGAARGTATEAIATNPVVPAQDQTINISRSFSGQAINGQIMSSRIGPASDWGRLYFNFTGFDSPTDRASVSVIAERLDGSDTLILENLLTSDVDLSTIPAQRYPYLRLVANLSDSSLRTPPQLRRWMVTYTGVPEGFLNSSIAGTTTALPDVAEGRPVNLRLAFQNISGRPFADSILVRTTISNNEVASRRVIEQKIKPLQAGDTAVFQIGPISTFGMGGLNNLQVYVNPQIQAEETYSNNVIDIPFRVITDRTNPLLEVAFDGTRIMDGDIVAPEPLITVALRDDNSFLKLGDTTNLELYLRRPGPSGTRERISLNSPDVRLIKREGDVNEILVEFRPKKLENGLHNLSVQGRDVSGNAAGGVEYSVNFNVINESSITHFYPYPNPFSSSTRFVFTLTGGKVPDDLKIQIMTISGRVVREIRKDELGPLRVGNNVTQFAWDGTDRYGDKLANGVYLYRVVLKDDAHQFDHRSTAADNTFKHGFGKLYIVR